MNTLGIRATPKYIYFAVVSSSNNNVTLEVVDKIVIPVCMKIPDQLSFVRTTLFSIVKEYQIEHAGIRRMEDNIPNKKLNPIITRAYFEGVIQELISNCNIEKYFSGKIQSISKLLSQQPNTIKKLFSGEVNLFDIVDWEKYDLEERECISYAIAAIDI